MAQRIQEMSIDDDPTQHEELKVTFYPELFLQRRIWVLNVLRRENITNVLDAGCGEGELLTVLCQPAPWLPAPPAYILPPSPAPSPTSPTPPSPTYNDYDIPNLHISLLHGLDISPNDLAFAVERTQPPPPEPEPEAGHRSYSTGVQRWEDLNVKLWKGGLETINEEFVDIECIVSTEVIEHLTPNVFPAFAPMFLGVYHPRFFLVTTPSYTFNARFTTPSAPRSARKGFPDPTKRTDRIFRHDDHKFEWTAEEFTTWCQESAKEWGYEVHVSTIGRALEVDEWGRDDELGGATSVAEFRRIDDDKNADRESRGRAAIHALSLSSPEHELLATHTHPGHPSSQHPQPLPQIAECAKAKMEEFREAFMRMEELWFEREIGVACGGWIEMLVRAVEESPDLVLKREDEGVNRRRSNWVVERVGADFVPQDLWAKDGGDSSLDYIPKDWTPGEGPHKTLSSESDFDEGESTGADGDVSWSESEDEEEGCAWSSERGWMRPEKGEDEEGDVRDWGSVCGDWGSDGEQRTCVAPPLSASSSTAGWDGDDDGSDTDTTS